LQDNQLTIGEKGFNTIGEAQAGHPYGIDDSKGTSGVGADAACPLQAVTCAALWTPAKLISGIVALQRMPDSGASA